MKVRDFMIRDITAVLQDENVGRVLKILSRQEITGIPVVDEDLRVVGFISENDIIRAALPSYFALLQTASFIPDLNQFVKNLKKLSYKPVADIMSKPAISVKESTPLLHAADLMIRHTLKVLPVIDESERLIGVITRMKILEAVTKGDM
ncbi:CBS domain-containing protein [Thermosipho ferrireducens]|uniref:CBS domain-containing protein n=1 Tax=Thermosipho ferrireducens TaxID=2571116 RepID=A0ABX7S6T1_9BACT|nr:CBS domain-containing protein [Thermosipho ferrireducens]QTA38289.1 CBS domain-containing protein [Thermosipho ferrireducens]